MAELLTTTENKEPVAQEGELLSSGAEEPVNNAYAKHEARSLDIAAATGINIFDIRDAVGKGQWNAIDAKLKESGARASHNVIVEETIAEGLAYEEPAEVTAEVLEERLAAVRKIEDLGSFFIAESLVGRSGNINPKAVNLMTNSQIALEKIEEGFRSANEGGKLVTFGDFMDRYLARQLIMGNIEDVTRTREKRSAAAASIMAGTDPLEFAKDGGIADQMVEKFAKQGVFTDENWYAKMDAIDWVEGGGFNEWADMDLIFGLLGALDIIGLARTPGAISKGIKASSARRATVRSVRDSLGAPQTPPAVAFEHGGAKAADAAVDNSSIARTGDTPSGAPTHLPSGTTADRRPGSLPPVGDGHVERVGIYNRLIKRVNDLMRKDVVTGSIDGASDWTTLLKNSTDEIISRLEASSKPIFTRTILPTRMISTELVQHTGAGTRGGAGARGVVENDLWSAKVVFGAGDSKGFNDIAHAEDMAGEINKRGFETNIVNRGTEDNPSYLVEAFDNIDPSLVANAAELDNVTKSMLGQGLGSAAISDTASNVSLANLSEQAYSLLRDDITAYEKIIGGARFGDKKDLNKIMEHLRDGGGPAGAAQREMYTESEFIAQWQNLDIAKRSGQLPSQKLMDAFWATVTMHDAAWFLEAHKLTYQLHRNGYKGISMAGRVVPAKKSKSVPSDAKVFSFSGTGVWEPPQTTAQLKSSRGFKDHVVWELDSPWEIPGGVEIKYVVGPTDIRNLHLEDVLPYNAGGRRTNAGSNWFLKFGGRAVMGAFSEKSILRAKRDLSHIQEGILATGVHIDHMLDAEIEALMRGRMAWAPDIQDAAAFRSATRKWDWAAKIDNKARGGRLTETEYSAAHGGMTEGEAAQMVNRRGDQMIRQYGGGHARQDTSLNAISKQLDNGVAELSYRTYDLKSKVSFLKKYYHNEGTGVKKAYTGNIDLQFDEAFDALMKKGSAGDIDVQLRSVGATIRRRQGVRGDTGKKIDLFNQRAREWVYDKTGYEHGDASIKGKLLSLGFESAFGFMNMAQFLLQASHSAVIVAISPKHGMRGAAMSMPMMGIMTMGSRPAAVVAKKNMAKVLGVPVHRIDEMIEYIDNSGRFNVMLDAIQADNLNARLPQLLSKSAVLDKTASIGGKALEVGRLPFIMGENVSRRTAIFTAMSEFMEEFPDLAMNSRKGRQWISNREHKLGFDMNAKSRAAWQSGEMAVPTQWLSYSMRYFEALMSTKFKPAERYRIGMAMLAMGGTTSLGAGFVSQLLGWDVTDAAAKKMGMDPGGTAYAAFKYSLFDGIVSWATEGKYQTAFGTRMAPVTAFTDLYRKLTEEGMITTLGGPSGEIFGNTSSAILGAITNTFDGNYQMSMMEMERFLRTPTGIDNAAKAIGMWNSGSYVSKTGTVMPYDYSRIEAMAQGLGMTNLRDAEYYYRRSQVWRKNSDMKKETKFMQRTVHDIWEAQRNGDYGKAQELANNMSDRINGGGWSPSQKNTLRKTLTSGKTGEQMMVALIDNLTRADGSDGDYARSVAAKLYRNTGE